MLPKTAIILAGGFGTRLSSVISDLPKPMAPVRNRPFLDYQLHWLGKHGFEEVIFSTGHLAEKIKARYAGSFEGIRIRYSHETSPLGTGGALQLSAPLCSEKNCLVLNGDSFFAIDLTDLMQKHQTGNAACTLALREVKDSSRYGSIELDHHHRITAFIEKGKGTSSKLINGGVYVMDLEIFKHHVKGLHKFSLETDFFAKKTQELMIKGFPYPDYFIDIGIPTDYERAQHEFERFEY